MAGGTCMKDCHSKTWVSHPTVCSDPPGRSAAGPLNLTAQTGSSARPLAQLCLSPGLSSGRRDSIVCEAHSHEHEHANIIYINSWGGESGYAAAWVPHRGPRISITPPPRVCHHGI